MLYDKVAQAAFNVVMNLVLMHSLALGALWRRDLPEYAGVERHVLMRRLALGA